MRWLAVTLAVAAIAGGVVAAAAFTSRIVNITARVEQPPTIAKYPLDPPPLTQAEVDAITEAAVGVSGCQPGDLEFPYEADTGVCSWWVMRISVRNNYWDPLVDLLVTDAFAGERDGLALPSVPVGVHLLSQTLGQAQMSEFVERVQIDWCVTEALQGGGCVPGGQLDPGQEAHLEVLVYTRPDPQGQQEFVAAGNYTLNGGPGATWQDSQGIVCAPLTECPLAPPVTVEAIGAAAQPTPTPTPTPEPTAEPTPAPTATPTPTPEATPASTPTAIPTP